MTDRPFLVRALAPLAVGLLVAVGLLWTRQEPTRQGGYCVNATVEIAGVLRRADTSGDVGRGPLPDIDAIFAQLDSVDVARFQVDTPSKIAKQVDAFAKTRSKEAFALIVQDYLERCRSGPQG